MLSLTDEDRTLLANLIPAAQRLIALDKHTLGMWLQWISDHERALLVAWAVHHGPDWITANIDLPDSASAHGEKRTPERVTIESLRQGSMILDNIE